MTGPQDPGWRPRLWHGDAETKKIHAWTKPIAIDNALPIQNFECNKNQDIQEALFFLLPSNSEKANAYHASKNGGMWRSWQSAWPHPHDQKRFSNSYGPAFLVARWRWPRTSCLPSLMRSCYEPSGIYKQFVQDDTPARSSKTNDNKPPNYRLPGETHLRQFARLNRDWNSGSETALNVQHDIHHPSYLAHHLIRLQFPFEDHQDFSTNNPKLNSWVSHWQPACSCRR